MNNSDILFDWTPDSLIEVTLPEPDNFLKVRETLTRIGVASKKGKRLYQSCFILHKQGKYFLVHFKELFILDGKYSDITLDDVNRRNAIAILLQSWGLVDIINQQKVFRSVTQPSSQPTPIKIVPYAEKKDWELIAKYTIGGWKNRAATVW